MNRYKTKEWKDLSDGEAGNFSEAGNSFEKSGNVVLYPKKNKLGPCREHFTQETGYEAITGSKKSSFIESDYLYYLVDTGSDLCIRRAKQDNTFVLKHTFTGATSGYLFFQFIGKIICSFYLGAYKIQYSDNFTVWADTNLISLVGNCSLIDAKVVYNKLYVLTSNGKICESSDGITFTLLSSLSPSMIYVSLEYLDGFLYVVSRVPDKD